MRSLYSAAVLVAALSVSAPSGLAQHTPDPSAAATDAAVAHTSNAEVTRAALGKMRDLLRAGIEQKQPSANLWTRRGQATVFDGSYDWHSCIAAHWALLSMSRTLRDADTAKWTLARLPTVVLQQELALLAPSPEPTAATGDARVAADPMAFIRPYADAWLLLLLDEMTRHEGIDAAAIADLRKEAEMRLLTQLELVAFPELQQSTATPSGEFVGHYRSWLFGYLAAQLVTPSSDAAKARREALRTTKLDPMRPALAAGPTRRARDFLDIGALYRVIQQREGTAGATPAEPSWTALPEVLPTIKAVHPIGATISETWPFAAAAATDAAARKTFDARTAAILQREDLWASDFAIATHWLPQFLWFGMWLATESTPSVAATTDASLKPKPKPKRVLLPAVGTTAPDFAMTDRDGAAVSLLQFRGKVVVLDFWATWCGPCKAAMPHLQELAKHYKDQGVVVLASCTNDERAKFDAWVDEHQDEYADIHFAYDPLGKGDDRASMALYGVMMIPVTLVLDREGKVCKAIGGYVAGQVLVDAALAKAGIEVSKEVLEQAALDEQKRKQKSGPAKVPATGDKKPADK